ncbi:MAG: glutamate-semialdehyde -aminomutase, partial [Chitinophagaceae bacterium]|nr:glutamate-semialdehyde -aminomutase [Chitinophagaceae bacterium]
MNKNKVSNANNLVLSEKANRLIPGGAHTYSKGDDQFPANAPKIIEKGLGCKLWDVDGNEFTDMTMSLGTTIMGHAYEPVLEAVRRELIRGVNFCRPSLIEGELAELLVNLIPSAEMVKFGKHGSDAVTGAVKLARAYTGKKYVARCAEDAFNAIHDWFIGSTVVTRGVPEEVQALTLKFTYNDIM